LDRGAVGRTRTGIIDALTTVAQPTPYVLGEEFAVTDTPGWDGGWVSLSSTTLVTQLTIHYWANP
jgi:hypothetical protein